MRPFAFRLETLLKFRQMQEEQAQIDFAQATAELIAAKDEQYRLESVLEEHLSLWRDAQQELVTVGTLKMLQDYYDKIKRAIFLQQQAVADAEVRRKECLVRLEAAARAKKLVEKLKEKRLMQYKAEALSQEQKVLDELGIQAFSRNR